MVKTVLLLLPGAFSGVGGIEMYNRQVVRAFLELGQERGFKVRTVLMNDSEADFDDRYIPAGSPPLFACGRRRVLFVFEALSATLRLKPDLVVFGHVHFARMAPVLKRISPDSKHWYFVYGIEVWHPLSDSIREGLALADTVLSISEYSAREVARNGSVPRQKIGLVPCALDEIWREQYSRVAAGPAMGNGAHRLLSVARLAASERYKGIDSVIRALPEISRAIPGVTYDVVGDGDDRPRLERVARELGVSDRVRFRGRLWPDELADAYRDCSLFVMPSSKEGFGIVFLEAALFGKPSVAGRHGGSPEVVEDEVAGLLVEREDVAGIARATTRLLSDDTLRQRMGAAARRRLMQSFIYPVFREALAKQVGADRAQVDVAS